MYSTESECLSTKLEQENLQSHSQQSMLGTEKRVRELKAERNDLVIWLNEYKLSKESRGRKVSEEEIVIEVMVGSVKQLEKLILFQDEKDLSRETNEDVINSYAEIGP